VVTNILEEHPASLFSVEVGPVGEEASNIEAVVEGVREDRRNGKSEPAMTLP
jgi:hypothetical protein